MPWDRSMRAGSFVGFIIGDWISCWNQLPKLRANVQQVFATDIGVSVIARVIAVGVKGRKVLKRDAANLTHFVWSCLGGTTGKGNQSHR